MCECVCVFAIVELASLFNPLQLNNGCLVRWWVVYNDFYWHIFSFSFVVFWCDLVMVVVPVYWCLLVVNGCGTT